VAEPAAGRPQQPGDGPPALAVEDALDLLNAGRMELEGRLVDASNTTLRAVITLDGLRARCVYKPVRGERPLWDFPDGTLADREVAAYLVSEATGWNAVPPTVLRDGPLGWGMCQLWIDEPEEAEPLLGFVPTGAVPAGWRPVLDAADDDGQRYVLAHADDGRLARLAALDVVINNADRKGGHVLHAGDGRVYGVDHGVCFHVEDKLRTILWGFLGQRLPEETCETLTRLREALDGGLGERLAAHLTRAEVEATRRRLRRLLTAGRYPTPGGTWPSVPWPPV
jgi:uncharacterized repeat protein (TIGR03843 family)